MNAGPPESLHDVSDFVELDGQEWYVVRDVDRMPPFLMSIVSDGDRWMFVSSSGGVTAGRRNIAGALFPYETDDRLHHLGGLNGPVTMIRVARDATAWRPMMGPMTEQRSRTLYKSVMGDSVMFEERDTAAGLAFRYRWMSSDQFGFIRTATLANEGDGPRAVELTDGLRNILPHGLEPSLYLPMGNLTNAYKRSEMIDAELRLAVYSLESLMTDRPEPQQAMRATVAWSVGLDDASLSLDPDAATSVVTGRDLDRPLVTGMPGAYLLRAGVELDPGEAETWSIAADVELDQPRVAALLEHLHSLDDRAGLLASSARVASQSLLEIVARADAMQCTDDEVATTHHLSNVTYNVMRGGLPMDGYLIDMDDFAGFVERRNRSAAARLRALGSSMGRMVQRRALLSMLDHTDDTDLRRLGREYLPFSFSRRHGDPSRPWNAFSIRTVDHEGNPMRYYEGNWRDIFQNWEALSMSFPEFLPDIVSVFVNASTPDGFNPYRITSDGIDWETPDPDDPWSNIGYWGDHQIVYLHRLLAATERYLPGTTRRLLGEARFTYADVPYRIVPYGEILDDPKATIAFDEDAASETAARVASVGADGKLMWNDDGVHHVTLAEKLLVPILAKLAGFVPDGGIWMNTQRPEWNDANNALVGYGLSMVTLYQLRGYLDFVREVLAGADGTVDMSREVADWLRSTIDTLAAASIAADPRSEAVDRKQLMDALGGSFSEYRTRIYDDGFTGTTPVPLSEVDSVCGIAIAHLDATISSGRRADGLYDSYNLSHIADDRTTATVQHLGEMLEGQVAVIESGVLDPDRCADIVDALFDSAMYRPDQMSFMLYPRKALPPFLERNTVPDSAIEGNPLLSELLDRGTGHVVTRDIGGRARFIADITTRELLENHLDRLAMDVAYRDLVDAHRSTTVRTYEDVFEHHSYTGRSGSMYAYEGLGSIYWHMVAKLLVAIQEATFRHAPSGAQREAIDRLVASYWRVRAGMGFAKAPSEHGAIPIDPYSHTPSHAGAQQPGMTGLVKEEILIRPAELGVVARNGVLDFDPTFVSTREMLSNPRSWVLMDISLETRQIHLPEGSLGSTVCQVPIVVSTTDGPPRVEVDLADGRTVTMAGASLGPDMSSRVFERSGEIACIRAFIPGRDGEPTTAGRVSP